MLRHKGPWKLIFCKEELESIFFWCIVTAWLTEKSMLPEDFGWWWCRWCRYQVLFPGYTLGELDSDQFPLATILINSNNWRQDLRLGLGKSFWIFINQGKASKPEIKTTPRDGGGGEDCSLDYRMIAWYKVHRIKGTIDKDWFMRQVNKYQIDSWYSTILIKSFDGIV